MNKFKIYLCGVGGQGIGLLNELIIRACGNAGYDIKGADTHGLAQRGGIVESYLKLGKDNFSPLITRGDADMVIALEAHEALRGMNTYLRNGGSLLYYNVSLQPHEVRIHNSGRVTPELIEKETAKRQIEVFKVFEESLSDRKLQNILIFGALCKNSLIPGVSKENYLSALKEVISPSLYENIYACFIKSLI